MGMVSAVVLPFPFHDLIGASCQLGDEEPVASPHHKALRTEMCPCFPAANWLKINHSPCSSAASGFLEEGAYTLSSQYSETLLPTSWLRRNMELWALKLYMRRLQLPPLSEPSFFICWKFSHGVGSKGLSAVLSSKQNVGTGSHGRPQTSGT